LATKSAKIVAGFGDGFIAPIGAAVGLLRLTVSFGFLFLGHDQDLHHEQKPDDGSERVSPGLEGREDFVGEIRGWFGDGATCIGCDGAVWSGTVGGAAGSKGEGAGPEIDGLRRSIKRIALGGTT